MFGLRNRFERFCFKHRYKGIPNLMLYITVGSAFVYILSLFNQNFMLYEWLCFDKARILEGQVWRLFSYVFAYAPGSNPVLILVSFYFFYNLSRATETAMGTFRFNIYYFCGVLLMDLFAMIFCPTGRIYGDGFYADPADLYSSMGYYLHLSMILSFTVVHPDAQFLMFFVLPIKAWVIALIDLLLILLQVYQLTDAGFFPHSLFPLVGIANFLLFAGKDVLNLLPESIRPNVNRMRKPARKKNGDAIPFTPADRTARPAPPKKVPYIHRCTVCGKTDVSDPDLEFRYCSRCNGYFCYCQEHISNHTHVE